MNRKFPNQSIDSPTFLRGKVAMVAYIHLKTTTITKHYHGDGKGPAVVEHETFSFVTDLELETIHAFFESGRHRKTFVAAYYAESVKLKLVKEETDSDKIDDLIEFLGRRKAIGSDLVNLILEYED
jgi:hypothetical protein